MNLMMATVAVVLAVARSAAVSPVNNLLTIDCNGGVVRLCVCVSGGGRGSGPRLWHPCPKLHIGTHWQTPRPLSSPHRDPSPLPNHP